MTAVLELVGEVVDCDGYRWEQDRVDDTWSSADYGLAGVTSEWLSEFRLVIGWGWALVCVGTVAVIVAAGAVQMRLARVSAARKRAELVDEWTPRDRRQP